jgi:arsenate reductase
MADERLDPRRKTTVLFLCRHNAARSQMAEALLRARFPERYDVASAGIAPAGIHPLALRVLEEAGVATHGLRSKHVAELAGRAFEIVVTVCGGEDPSCPVFPAGKQWHRVFSDPSAVEGSEKDRLSAFRRVRDEMDSWIRATFAT